MSKYTTEVRFICETDAGISESVGYSKVDEVLDKSWNKIFDSGEWEIYDEEYRPILCKKILKHFYTREIGAETAGLWKLWLNQRMTEIMPYYNQLYKSTLLEFNPLYDTDYTTSGNRQTDEGEQSGRETESDYTRTDDLQSKRTDDLNSKRIDNLQANKTYNSEQTRTDNLHENTSGTRYDLYSDTPQGALTGVESETYLTNARKITDTGTRDNTGTQQTETNGNDLLSNTGSQDINNTGTQTIENTGNVNNKGKDTENTKRVMNNTQDYAEHVMGKRGTQSYPKMIMELRDSFINIDMMIIDELNDLFFNLW